MLRILKLISFFCLILAVLINFNWLKIPTLSLILGLLYFVIFGYLLGKNIFYKQNFSFKAVLGIFSLLSLYSLLGAIIYYFYQLDAIVINILLIIISGYILYPHILPKDEIKNQFKFPKLSLSSVILSLTYLILFAISIFILWKSQTIEAIYSPWQVIPKEFFAIYILATFNLILLILYDKCKITPVLIGLHYFLTTSVALFIYRLGYGFDPFIHQTTESIIFNQGFILPKPFYYLGQYSLVVFLAHFLQISVEWIDKLLLPILLSVFLPYTICKSIKKTFILPRNICHLLGLSFLFLPFSLFITTTPQALANLFCIMIIFLSFLYLEDKQIPFPFLILLALASLAIHAISGIPIIIYLVIIYLIKNKNLATKIILPIFAIVSALALPISLLINSFISIYKVSWQQNAINFIDWPSIFTTQYKIIFDLSYLYRNSIYWLLILITITTLIYLIKIKKAQIFLASLLAFAILIINAFLLNFIKVNFIIEYEQGDFAKRVWQLAFYFLLPITCYGLYIFIQKAWQKSIIYKSFLIFTLTLALALSVYLSYPRYDDYDNSKFINVSAADFQAVQYIENDSQGENYIVLSNQMTSAAALKIFGFTKYYNGNYFYPIPTGGELYKFYEKMLYTDTSKETMIQAMDFVGVKVAYFILPTYWKQFATVDQAAQKAAGTIYNLGDKIFIYKFSK
ncbi:hypothetical protein JW977_04535 [Candidatus Falkowbacteria bacterium]|nr:hypothetical protein [Candidatus Falkowbacteria bacterium]